MTHEQQSKLLGEFYAEEKNILKLKGEDYANEDVLSNFKSAGSNIGISPELQCLSLIATKVARLGNLLSGKKPNNESVSDSILDLSNYTDLLYCLVNENVADVVKVSKEKQRSILKAMMAADEKDGLYEPKTKRWENVEPIKNTYEPKVGDRFKSKKGEICEITTVEKLYCVLLYDDNSDMHKVALLYEELNSEIEKGILKKINSESKIADHVIKDGDKFIDQEAETFIIQLIRDEKVIYRYKKSSKLDTKSLGIEQFLENIRKGVFKRIN